ncbi:MAG: hypothetical protein HRU40_22325, partial [Saprospiraceae bacterium]|nr:hypothetical protein [Saprospiraceae bacterium]
KIGVKSQKQNGQRAVNLILEGSFLDKTYGSNNPLSWDVISQSPPSVGSGAGNKIFDLRSYLNTRPNSEVNVKHLERPT